MHHAAHGQVACPTLAALNPNNSAIKNGHQEDPSSHKLYVIVLPTVIASVTSLE